MLGEDAQFRAERHHNAEIVRSVPPGVASYVKLMNGAIQGAAGGAAVPSTGLHVHG